MDAEEVGGWRASGWREQPVDGRAISTSDSARRERDGQARWCGEGKTALRARTFSGCWPGRTNEREAAVRRVGGAVESGWEGWEDGMGWDRVCAR